MNARRALDLHRAGRNAEAASEALHARAQAGLPPASFDVDTV